MTIRQPAVAGTFYPDSPDTLSHMITGLLDEAKPKDFSPKALVVPHAGLIYSGPIAATAYRLLRTMANDIRKVVLLGPSHRVPLQGLALPACDAFVTPLGQIPLDLDAMAALQSFSQVQVLDQAHAQEHSLEVQCPFLQACLNEFTLIPIVVGDCSALSVAEVIEQLWGEQETLIIISSDLSHFHNYEEACYRDQQTAKAIEQLSSNLTGGQACGCNPLNGMLKVAQSRGMDVITLDVRNSGDTAGDKSRVVGYGSFVIQ